MVGRNEPCPCGSGKKYKKCCERVVALSAAEKAREQRDRSLKRELMMDMFQWFQERYSTEMRLHWANQYKELLCFPLDQPIPKEFTVSFHFWLLFDAPCINDKRPVDLWLSTIRHAPQKERMARQFAETRFECFEVIDEGEQNLVFQSLADGVKYKVRKNVTIPQGRIVFTRLIRVGNGYELFGPYTSFVHEMRGEILVQLEKYNHREEERQDYISYRVLGWSIQEAKDKGNAMPAPPDLPEAAELSTALWTDAEPRQEEVPMRIIHHLDQFFMDHVAVLQKGTQSLYSRTLEYFHQYVSSQFGSRFDWSVLTEEVFVHFLSVWYMDHCKNLTYRGARIFLNSLKYLFRWLDEKGLSPVYASYRTVYASLIRALPMAVEAKRWLKEHGVLPHVRSEAVESMERYMLYLSSTGPVLWVADKWIPVHLMGVPTQLMDQRLMIVGSVKVESSGCYFTRIEGVYPVVQMDKDLQALENK